MNTAHLLWKTDLINSENRQCSLKKNNLTRFTKDGCYTNFIPTEIDRMLSVDMWYFYLFLFSVEQLSFC